MATLTLDCDAEGCGHKEEIEALTRDLIGKPCPKCGASLLTEEDYEGGQRVVEVMGLVESVFGVADPNAPGEKLEVCVNYHDGELRVSMKDA